MILISSVALFSLGAGLNGGGDSEFPFKEKWREVEKLRNDGKPKSALEVVEVIYTAAKQYDSKPNLLRSIIARHSLAQSLEEVEYATLIQRMEAEIESANDREVKALLQSATASMYAQYVMRHSYRLRDRIDIGSLPDEINLWSIRDIEERSDELILESLDEKKLKDISLEEFKLHDDSELKIKPLSLKPYLIQQGIYHFENDLTSMTKVKDQSSLSQSIALSPIQQFLDKDLGVELNTESRRDNTVSLYQKLLAYYQDQPIKQAKIDINRLNYSESKYQSQKQTLADLESDYFEALRQGMNESKDSNQSAVYGVTLAKKYFHLASQYQTEFDPGYSNLAVESMEIVEKLSPIDKNLKAIIAEFKRTVELSFVNFTLDEVILPNRSVPFALNVKNVAEVKLSLHQLTHQEYRDAKMKSYEEGYHKILKKKPQYSQWSEILDTPQDYLNHSSELILPSLELGHYVMFVKGVSTEGKPTDGEKFVLFQVSSQEIVKWTDDLGNNLQVIDRTDGNPMSGANIELYTRNRQNRTENLDLLSTLTTDQDGKALVVEKNNVRNLYLVSRKGEDILVADFYYQRSNTRRNKRSKPHVFLDRSIYRPGQMVHGKIVHLTYDSDNMPEVLKNTNLTIRLKDANNQEVTTQQITTNDYGVSVFSVTVPSDGLKGNYRLYFEHADGNSSTQIKVEEYKRPTLEGSLDPIEGTVVLGDSVRVSGSVNTLSGFPSQGSKVSYTISESPYYQWYRCGWSSWWYPPYQSQSQIIATGQTTTDKQGKFLIGFGTDKTEIKLRQKGKQYTVDVVITDQSGETLTHSKSVYVTQSHFRINHTLPSIIDLDDKDFVSPTVSGLNLDGESIDVKSSVTLQRMKTSETFYRTRNYKLDYLQYSEEEFASKKTDYRYPTLGKGEAVDETFKALTVDIGNLESALYQLRPGDYKLTISGTSDDGHQAEGTHRVLVYDKNQESPHLLLFTDEQSIITEVDSEVELPILIHEEVNQIYYKKIRGAQIVEEGWLSRKEYLKKKFVVTRFDMGGFTLEVSCNLKGERAKISTTVKVPYVDTNVDLTLDLESLLLPGSPYQLDALAMCDGKPVSDANLTLVMYDAALDQLYPHNWKTEFYPTFYSQVYEQALSRSQASVQWVNRNNRGYHPNAYLDLNMIPRASWYGIIYNISNTRQRSGGRVFSKSRQTGGEEMMYSMEESAPAPAMMADADMVTTTAQNTGFASDDSIGGVTQNQQTPPPVRSDFGETVFFDTDGLTDKQGSYRLDFETNDAITKWKVLAFVHDREMRYGFAELTTQTNKPIQIIQTPTRTLSEGDVIQWPITVQNSSDKVSAGTASIKVMSYLNQEDVTDLFIAKGKTQSLSMPAGEATTLLFDLQVPEDFKDRVDVITQFISDEGSDAESRNLPVFSTDQYLTSGDPIWVQGGKNASLDITPPQDADTETLTLEIVSNPFWMVARSFPMLAQLDRKVTTSLSDHIVVESIGQEILKEYPQMERVMESQALQSEGTPLNRNEDLKIQELSSTPWVRQAQQAETRIADFAKYFNRNNSTQRLNSATTQLWKRQNGDGGWPWVTGGRSSLYTSLRVLTDLAQIHNMGVSSEMISNNSNIQKALNYTDGEIQKIEKRLKYKDRLPYLFITDLYLYSLLPDNYRRPSYHSTWLKQLEEQWHDLPLPYQALAGKIFIKNGKTSAVEEIKESLLERAITRDDGTVFWRGVNEYYSYHNNYSTQTLVLGFLSDAGVNGDVIDRGSQWLIANKRSNEWYDIKGTAAVVYYLYNKYGAKIDDGESISISINGKPQELKRSLTYSTLELDRNDYSKDLKLEISNSEDYPIFGGLYRQFFQPIDKVTRHPAAQNLSIKKSLFVKTTNGNEVTYLPLSNEDVNVGDEVKVRLEIEAFDRLSYVYVTDTRPSGTQPSDQLSGYQYRNGLYTYQSPNDNGQEFFIEVLPKGTHTLEYSIRVLHAGDFTSGVAEIQSFYVPEFSAYDNYGRVETLPLSLDSMD